MPRSERLARGFGLLEAIVALVLLAGTGVALFDWINSSLQTAARIARLDAQARLLLSAQAAISSVNPSARPQGELSVGGLNVRWSAVLAQPERSNATDASEIAGPWWVSLYRMDVSAKSSDGVEVNFSQLQVGTRRAQPMSKAP